MHARIEPSDPRFDPHLDALPDGVSLASPWRRLAAVLLEVLLLAVTAIVGWIVWAIVVARRGQSPAKQLLGLRVIRPGHRRPAGLVWMVLVRGLVGAWAAVIGIVVTLGALFLLPFWDRYNRTAIDLMSDCWVVVDPRDAYRADPNAW